MKTDTGRRNRKEVMEELLFELHEICKRNDLHYTLTGIVANSAGEEERFPEEYDYLTVAMTQGDIERLVQIVNGTEDTHRQVEYFLNNPYARGFQVRYCNNDTTLINVKEFGNHINYGMYVRIRAVERIPEKGMRTEFLNLCRKAWKGSQKRLASCNYKRFVPALILKCTVGIIGRKNAAKALYHLSKQLKFIDKWEEIKGYEKVRIGTGVFEGESVCQLKEVPVDGGTVFLSEALMHRIVEHNPSHATVTVNDIEASDAPFKSVMDSGIVTELKNAQEVRDRYLSIVTKANKHAKAMGNAWNTYLMTRDVLEFQETYTEERIERVKAAVAQEDILTYKEEMHDYLAARRRWRRLHIPFIENEELEQVITSGKAVFGDDGKDDGNQKLC